jgi:rRNA processing protein Krr1/Pno1
MRIFRVIGARDAIGDAIALINDIVSKAAWKTGTVSIPERLVGPFIGAGGAGVKEKQEAFGVRITHTGGGSINITGKGDNKEEKVERTIEAIKKFVEDKEREWEAKNFKESVLIPEWAVTKWLRRGRERIRALSEAHGVRMHFADGSLHIVGCESNVQSAREQVQSAIEQDKEDQFEAIETISDRDVGKFIGKQGSNVQKMEQTHRVRISVDACKVKVIGKEADVNKACEEVRQFVASARQETVQGSSSYGVWQQHADISSPVDMALDDLVQDRYTRAHESERIFLHRRQPHHQERSRQHDSRPRSPLPRMRRHSMYREEWGRRYRSRSRSHRYRRY